MLSGNGRSDTGGISFGIDRRDEEYEAGIAGWAWNG